ncbi:helix-turn-helix domain-containing protein [Faecalibaculum rodentium]|uniref:helix-turn-helix domain-containing protein n=1 Tax=Faecalibaculum rodentium TaxID=1702221 RepID=UPI00256FECE1|nr:helix-turn-helix domain-containing protein [Faecalibaculum rodentium]
MPFNRQELADYLGVERSALSAELGKMKREGLVSFRKNEFTLNGRTRETAI